MLGSYYAGLRDIPHKLVHVLLWLQPEKYTFRLVQPNQPGAAIRGTVREREAVSVY